MTIFKKGQSKIKVLIIILVIILIATIFVLYTNLTKQKIETSPEETAIVPINVPIDTTFNLEILKELTQLDLKLFGELPIAINDNEIERTNPFIPY